MSLNITALADGDEHQSNVVITGSVEDLILILSELCDDYSEQKMELTIPVRDGYVEQILNMME
ncbi:hypothetical protein [Glaciecola sp. 1036]|uniref:hypothetical protein n=1 Tax=Alteromonadaceae TaxID=72275 RepID=UPI003D0818A3